MYSLYRAWLSLGPCGTLQSSAPLQLPGAPDVALQVGPTLTHFSAHRAVLATHSGYFKAALTTHTGHNPIAVPNVNVDEFSSLLTFMYTGFLDLNINNIYNILLATHILHMPRALELCRNYLIQQHPMEAAAAAGSAHVPPTSSTVATVSPASLRPTGGVIKPIASRKSLLPLHQQFYQPTLVGAYSNLHSSDGTPFRAVEKQDTEMMVVECTPSTSKKRATPTLAAELPDTTTNHPIPQPRCQNSSTKSHFGSDRKSKKRSETFGSSSHAHNSHNAGNKSDAEKTIIDIACCDGPVRFHRVINNNYGITAATLGGMQDNSMDSNSSSIVTSKEVNQRNDAMNKAMTVSINNKKLMCDENAQQQQQQQTGNGSATDLFTCVYCNHTFKSQYCYQKHARRHLNPVSLEAGAAAVKPTVTATAAPPAAAAGDANRREVKLLDMNVQYYPCKTCGSKFPSYYFVHKHRKLCHAEEMQVDSAKQGSQGPSGGGGGSQTQQSEEPGNVNVNNPVSIMNNDSSSHDKNDSTIDVVDTSE